ncbi:hypothetical protein HW130_23175 [Streptomyces sp. PKU-EA00015]|uniref:hypothetical protein n=1 Tax=Streptomyces sp. PKU-EA00015 TaxID=2748326 RepID=UPI0015A3F3DF|nr:hypothetical protein [Streptomyces sp. PKU-EA00015]NWF29120.1 hypothetical protein [Streptomyces sp. PKU-EA00015]
MSDVGRAQQTGQAAREQASATAGQAGQAAGQVGGVAAEKARNVAGQAREQAGTAVRDLQGRLREEARGQTERFAGTMRQWADDLAGLAENAPGDSPARSMAAQAADGGHRAADYLDKQGLEGLLGDLQSFARRRPGAFLGGAVLAGLVVGRLAKAGTQQGRSPDRQPAAPARDEAPLPPAAAPRVGLPGPPGV